MAYKLAFAFSSSAHVPLHSLKAKEIEKANHHRPESQKSETLLRDQGGDISVLKSLLFAKKTSNSASPSQGKGEK